MSLSVYVFTRQAKGARGQKYREAATVFAESPEGARKVLEDKLAPFAGDGTSDVASAYRVDSPEWSVEEVVLSEPRIVTWHMTSDTP